MPNLYNEGFTIRTLYIISFYKKKTKMDEIILISKPGIDQYNASSCRPISPQPVMGRLFEYLLLNSYT